MSNEAAEILTKSIQENYVKPKLNAEKENYSMKIKASVIGVGAAGGNIAHLMSEYGYETAAFNTTQSDMIGLNVKHKVVIDEVNGSGKDRAFATAEFKKFYTSFFEHDGIKKLLENDLIFIAASGGGGTGTIISIMIAGYLKNEYPNKTIFNIGLLGSIKEDQVSQENMKEFMSDLENKTNCPYLLFDNNRVKNKVGDDVYETVNNDVVNSIRILSKEFFIENTRSNIDGRDYARLTSFNGLTSVISINKLNISVTEDKIDLIGRVEYAIDNSTAIVTDNPEAYGFFLNTDPNVYSVIDTTFDEIQEVIGHPSSGLVFKHLQNDYGKGPEFAMILTGMSAPINRFNQIDRRIQEYKNVKEKAKLPTVERNTSALNLAGDGQGNGKGKGSSFLDSF